MRLEVLLGEDSPGDVRLTQEAFESLVRSINDFWLTKVKLPQQRPSG
ncbi:MAG: hypothetical protein ABI837_11565 [Acidobacteriota bacterium]